MRWMLALLLVGCGSDSEAPTAQTWWRPAANATWHIQLSGETDTTRAVDVYDVDMTDVPADVFAAIKARGAKLVCYFSAGSVEDWRDDAADFPSAAVGKDMEGWPGEKWIDIRSPGIRTIMQRRLDDAVARGCDAVDPDNINGFENDSGFPLSEADTVAYVKWLAAEGHARGLGVGLKNGGAIAADVVGDVDFEVNEECLSFDECGDLAPFVAAQKAVLHIQYVETEADGPAAHTSVCGDARRNGFFSTIKRIELDAWALDCD